MKLIWKSPAVKSFLILKIVAWSPPEEVNGWTEFAESSDGVLDYTPTEVCAKMDIIKRLRS